MFQAVEPGQQFGDGKVKLRRNVLVDVDLGQQGDQFRGLMNINAVFLGSGDYFLGNQAFPFGDDARCCIGLSIGKRDGFAFRITGAARHFLRKTGSNSIRQPQIAVAAIGWRTQAGRHLNPA